MIQRILLISNLIGIPVQLYGGHYGLALLAAVAAFLMIPSGTFDFSKKEAKEEYDIIAAPYRASSYREDYSDLDNRGMMMLDKDEEVRYMQSPVFTLQHGLAGWAPPSLEINLPALPEMILPEIPVLKVRYSEVLTEEERNDAIMDLYNAGREKEPTPFEEWDEEFDQYMKDKK